MHRSLSNRTRGCSSAVPSAGVNVFPLVSSVPSRGPFLGQLRPLSGNVPATCMRVVSRLFYACAFITIWSIDLSQYRRVFLTARFRMICTHLAVMQARSSLDDGQHFFPRNVLPRKKCALHRARQRIAARHRLRRALHPSYNTAAANARLKNLQVKAGRKQICCNPSVAWKKHTGNIKDTIVYCRFVYNCLRKTI